MIRLINDETGRYLDAGSALDMELCNVLQPFFDRDHNPRELMALIVMAANDLACQKVLGWLDPPPVESFDKGLDRKMRKADQASADKGK